MNFPSPSERFALTTAGLCRVVAASIARGVMTGAMIVLVWTRVKRAEVAFLALVARVRDGTYRGGWVRKGVAGVVGGSADCRDAASDAAGGPVPVRVGLPRRFGWLMGMIPGEAACFGSQLRTLLAEPEMAALVADVPQARRILGPLCWMLGVELPGRLAPVARVEVAVRKRASRVRKVMDFGRVPLPRGVLSWARREGFGKFC